MLFFLIEEIILNEYQVLIELECDSNRTFIIDEWASLRIYNQLYN